MKLGIDVGFGDVKAVYQDNEQIQYLKIPTAVKYAGSNTSAGIAEEGVYSFQGREYIVGEYARYEAFSTRSYEFLRRYSGLLIHHVIKTNNLQPDKIAIGLPLSWYDKKADFLQELKSTMVDGERIQADVTLFPQAVGVLMDYRLGTDGNVRSDTNKNGIVIDVGYNTVDILCFENGAAIRADSATIEKFGLSKVILELSDHIHRKHAFQLSDQEAKEAFVKKSLTLYGDVIDISEVARNVTEKYFEELISAICSRWESRLQRAEVLLFAGGGAVILKEYMPAAYAKIMAMPVNPEFSNARGYLKGLEG